MLESEVMKTCGDYETSVAHLALGLLDAPSAIEVRDHLNSCPACAEYYRQISNVTGGFDAREVLRNMRTSLRSTHRFLFQIGNE